MTAPFLRETPVGIYLAIKVQPRASRNQIIGLHGNEIKISLTAPPVDSAANQALIDFLAHLLSCPRSAIQLTRGHNSRHKTIFITRFPAASVFKALGLHR